MSDQNAHRWRCGKPFFLRAEESANRLHRRRATCEEKASSKGLPRNRRLVHRTHRACARFRGISLQKTLEDHRLFHLCLRRKLSLRPSKDPEDRRPLKVEARSALRLTVSLGQRKLRNDLKLRYKYFLPRRGSIIGNAAVLKTAARKGLQVRVLSPPPCSFSSGAPFDARTESCHPFARDHALKEARKATNRPHSVAHSEEAR